MSVKDRLKEFQDLSSKAPRPRASTADSTIRFEDGRPATSESLLNAREEADIEKFLQRISNVQQKFARMNDIVKRIHVLHKNLLISPDGTPEPAAELNEIVNEFQTYSRAFKVEAEEASRIGEPLAYVKTNQVSGVARAFRDVMQLFNAEHVKYRNKCEERIKDYLSVVNLDMNREDMDKAIESGTLFNTMGIMMAERDKKQLFEDVQERHKEILQTEADIRQLHEIFLDMNMLIENQGEMVDRIDANVENAAVNAQKALENVNYAKTARSRNIKLKVGLTICAILVVLFLFIFLTTAFCVYVPLVC